MGKIGHHAGFLPPGAGGKGRLFRLALLVAAALLPSCAARPTVQWRTLPARFPDLHSVASPLARAIVEEAAAARRALLRERPELVGRDPILQRPPLLVEVSFFADEVAGERRLLSRVLEEELARALHDGRRIEVYPNDLTRRWVGALRPRTGYGEALAVASARYSQAQAVLFGGFRLVGEDLRVRAELVVVERPRPPRPPPLSFFWPVAPKPQEPERRRLARLEARVSLGGIPQSLFLPAPRPRGFSLPVPPPAWQRPPVALRVERILPGGSRASALGGGVLGPEDTLSVRLLALRPVHLYVATLDEGGKVSEVVAAPGGRGALRREAGREVAAIALIRPSERQVRLIILARERPLDVEGVVVPALRRLGRLWRERGTLPPGADGLSLPGDIYQRSFWYYRAPAIDSPALQS